MRAEWERHDCPICGRNNSSSMSRVMATEDDDEHIVHRRRDAIVLHADAHSRGGTNLYLSRDEAEALARMLAPHLMDADEAVEWVQENKEPMDVFPPR